MTSKLPLAQIGKHIFNSEHFNPKRLSDLARINKN